MVTSLVAWDHKIQNCWSQQIALLHSTFDDCSCHLTQPLSRHPYHLHHTVLISPLLPLLPLLGCHYLDRSHAIAILTPSLVILMLPGKRLFPTMWFKCLALFAKHSTTAWRLFSLYFVSYVEALVSDSDPAVKGLEMLMEDSHREFETMEYQTGFDIHTCSRVRHHHHSKATRWPESPFLWFLVR
jgi:hypothetical protein